MVDSLILNKAKFSKFDNVCILHKSRLYMERAFSELHFPTTQKNGQEFPEMASKSPKDLVEILSFWEKCLFGVGGGGGRLSCILNFLPHFFFGKAP